MTRWSAITRWAMAAAVATVTIAALDAVVTAPAARAADAGADPSNALRVRITNGGEGPASERLLLPLNKAAIVELPVDAHDVLVSNPEVADAVIRTPRRAFVLGVAGGQTNAFFFDAAGDQILNLEIQVERDVAPVQQLLDRHIPDGRVTVEALNDTLVLSGLVGSTSEADRAVRLAAQFVDDPEKVVSLLSVDTAEQVLLKVRIVEMQRSVVKQLGVDITNLTARFTDELAIGVATGNEFNLAGRALGGLAATVDYDNLGGGDIQSIDGTLRALERVGLVRTLAEPNLTAITGEPAKFLAGGEFPVPAGRDRQGNVSVEYKPFGVGLGFTPMVLSDGRISVFVSTEVSELTTQGAVSINASAIDTNDDGIPDTILEGLTLPALKVRRTETTVELPSGGSLVIAGLIQDRTEESVDGTPGAMRTPGLGALFRARDFESEETELVVIVTPYLVNPTSADSLATPADGYQRPSDLDALFFGRISRTYRAADAPESEARWRGPIGFILDEEGAAL